MVTIIIYGSLYPWVFETHPLPARPIYLLFHSWDANFADRRFVFDVAVNIIIYIPLGMSAFLAFRRFGRTTLELLTPVAIGTLQSASLEMLQLPRLASARCGRVRVFRRDRQCTNGRRAAERARM